MYEVHIGFAKASADTVQTLQSVGWQKVKFFLTNINVACHRATGHDIAIPWAMATSRISQSDEAMDLVCRGMEVLRQSGVQGNFEIESFDLEAPEIALPARFRVVPNSPSFENHLIWRGIRQSLPTITAITGKVATLLGAAHQVVDFARKPLVDADIMVSRVVTIYQDSIVQTRKFDRRAQAIIDELGCHRVVAEKVLVVGQPI